MKIPVQHISMWCQELSARVQQAVQGEPHRQYREQI